ncbi:hypothetical protein ACOSQ3_005445 [Xanthoceras sorbifolium]
MDGSSNQNDSGASLILIDLDKTEFSHYLHFDFKPSNNEADYKALLAGLRITKELKVRILQFDNKKFRKFCNTYKIEYRFASTAHPQFNGLVESTNKTIKKLIKKKLEDAKENWANELPHILWAYRKIERTSTEETPFSLAFRVEVVLPAEIGLPYFRVSYFSHKNNNDLLSVTPPDPTRID